MTSEHSTRKPGIDALVARELKHRERIVRFLWVLIAVAFTLTGWIAYKGYNAPVATAKRLAKQPDFTTKTADTLASSKDFEMATAKRLEASPEFVGTTAAKLENNADFVNRVAKAAHSSQDILANSLHEVQGLQSNLQDRLTALERRLSDMGQQMEILKTANAQHQRNITDITGRQTRLEESQTLGATNIEQRLLILTRDIEALKKEQVEFPRVYLLKTSQWNDLTALGMRVKLGHKIGETISEFAIQKDAALCERKSAVQLGQPFFCDVGTSRYGIELIYVVTRFLLKDYVGMEIVLVPSD